MGKICMCTYSKANEGHTYVNLLGQPNQIIETTKVLLILIVYIEFVDLFFSVKRVANYCRISQISVLVFSSKVSSYNR